MVICQYFLQGRCSFGAKCRNEHVYKNDGRGGKNSGQTDLLWQIHNEVTEAEKGGLWPLTSYGPKKEGPSIPGWNDISPEEVRWTLYEAQKNGTVNQAINHINQLHKNAEEARNALKQPSQKMISILTDIVKERTPSQSSSSIFSNPNPNSSASGFRFDVAANNVFGGCPQPSMASPSIFGGSQAPSANPTSGSIFGGTLTPNQGTSGGSIFGGNQTASINSTTGSIFGGSSGGFYNQNIFGSQMTSTPAKNTTSNIFSQTQPQYNMNVFSQVPSQGQPQGQVSTQNIFTVTPESQPQTNIFGQPQQSSNIFGNNSTFSSYQSFNVFGESAKPATDNPFQTQNSDPVQPFGAANKAVIPNSAGTEQDFSAYSKMEDLTEEEMKSFTSTMFTFGNIPLKPPPQQYC